MTEADIQAAFDLAFKAIGGIGDKAVQGEVYTPIQDRPYCKSSFTGSSSPAGFDAFCPVVWQGTYKINVNMPSRGGIAAARAVAAIVSNAFPRGRSVVFFAPGAGTNQGVSVMQTNAPSAETNGDWITIPVLIQWMGSDP
ncbi:MAG: phage tail terminator-like protein [Rhodospirillales bacterium]